MKRSTLIQLGCLTAALTACDAPATSQQPSATAASAQAAAASAKPSSSAAATPLKNAKPKTYAFTKADALGSLPKGVGIAVGQKAPAFSLPSVAGGDVSLETLLAKGPALLVFYRGGW